MNMKTIDENKAYRKAVARMESEVKRAKARVELLKMLYKELLKQKHNKYFHAELEYQKAEKLGLDTGR